MYFTGTNSTHQSLYFSLIHSCIFFFYYVIQVSTMITIRKTLLICFATICILLLNRNAMHVFIYGKNIQEYLQSGNDESNETTVNNRTIAHRNSSTCPLVSPHIGTYLGSRIFTVTHFLTHNYIECTKIHSLPHNKSCTIVYVDLQI